MARPNLVIRFRRIIAAGHIERVLAFDAELKLSNSGHRVPKKISADQLFVVYKQIL